MRVLVVEDEKKMASFIRKALLAEGLAVDVSHTGEEALALAVAVPFDVTFSTSCYKGPPETRSVLLDDAAQIPGDHLDAGHLDVAASQLPSTPNRLLGVRVAIGEEEKEEGRGAARDRAETFGTGTGTIYSRPARS